MSGATAKICFRFRRWIKSENVIPEDVEKLFNKYSENERMSSYRFGLFLEEYQKETEEDVRMFVEKVFSKYKKHKKGLRLHDFFHYLLDDLNHPLNFQECEDNMEAPMSHYFWHSGYDSYLYFKWRESIKGHNVDMGSHSPFGGRTIFDSIKKALQGGVKVIELDLKPRSHKDGFDVEYQGMTSPVSFKKCLIVIKENAFAKVITDNACSRSHHPIIVILGYDNLTDDLEAQLIKMIKKTLGELWCPDIGLDSLKEQKNKIIILTRNKPVTSDNKNGKKEVYKLTPLKEHKDGQPEHSVIAPNISDLRVRVTQENLIGVYLNPTGTGISSSEYDPLIGWSRGAQMVACSMKADSIKADSVKADSIKADSVKKSERHIEKYIEKYVWIMQGMFRAYGGTGFANKPDILLRSNPEFDPNAWRPVKMILKVKVYMGTGWHMQFDNKNFDPTSPPDFFAAIEIVGVPRDEAREKTLPAMDKWIPKWEQEFKFPLTVPELAFVMIKVSDFDSDRTHEFGGQTCLPVSTLKTRGIRSVPLYDFRGRPHRPPVKLLVRFQVDQC